MIAKLQALVDSKENWLIAMGIRRPHLPFRAPQRFLDYYAKLRLESRAELSLPKRTPLAAHSLCTNLFEAIELEGVPEKDDGSGRQFLPDESILYIRENYMAAASWADEVLGRVLNELDRLNLTDSTLVAVVSDHGFSTGEHNAYCKRSLYDIATHVPFILRGPGLPPREDSEPISLLDFFPTVAELAGVHVPSNKDLRNDGYAPIEGKSQAARARYGPRAVDLGMVLAAKARGLVGIDENSAGGLAAFSEQPACFGVNRETGAQTRTVCERPGDFQQMGYSIRTSQWLYIEWRPWLKQSDSKGIADWTISHLPGESAQLYQLGKDTQQLNNVAMMGLFGPVKEALAERLREHFLDCARDTSGQKHMCSKEAHCQWLNSKCRTNSIPSSPTSSPSRDPPSMSPTTAHVSSSSSFAPSSHPSLIPTMIPSSSPASASSPPLGLQADAGANQLGHSCSFLFVPLILSYGQQY